MQGTFFSDSVQETIEIGAKLGKSLKSGDAVFFIGGMGAGKTHFTKGIAKSLGIKEEITSPTFTLVNEYQGKLPLFHFDLFRISDYDDLYAVGFFDYHERGGVIVIEWAENVRGIFDDFPRAYIVEIEAKDSDKRKITIKSEELKDEGFRN